MLLSCSRNRNNFLNFHVLKVLDSIENNRSSFYSKYDTIDIRRNGCGVLVLSAIYVKTCTLSLIQTHKEKLLKISEISIHPYYSDFLLTLVPRPLAKLALPIL